MATSARQLRSRVGTPLPAVPSRASNAYGAQGKASLHTQVTTSATDFDNAFQNALPKRSAATPKPRRSVRKTRSVASEAAVEQSDDVLSETITTVEPKIAAQVYEESESFDERPGTAIQASAIYGGETARPVNSVQPIRQMQSQASTRARSSKQTSSDRYEPGRFQVFSRTLPRYLPRLFQDANSYSHKLLVTTLFRLLLLIALSVILFGIFSYAPLPKDIAFRRNAAVQSTSGYLGLSRRPPQDWERKWYSFLHDKLWARELENNTSLEQYHVNVNLLTRVEKLENRLAELGEQLSLHHETIATLQDILPSAVVVRKVNGKWQIEPHFWDAFADRLSQGETAPPWQAFLKANEEKWNELSAEVTGQALDKAVASGQIMSASSFSELVDENFQWLRTKYQEDFKGMQKSHFDLIQSIANQSAIDVFNRSPLSSYAKTQLETLVKANQIHSAYEALRSPNYFSVGMGARIDHRLTSPTMQNPPTTWVQWLWTRLSPWQYDKHPPIAALQRWEEATDCWCSSPSRDRMGKAQLTVRMPYEIYPDVLIVEHVPGTGTLDIASAPRELEIWAELDSPQRAEQMVAEMAQQVPLYHERSSKCGRPPQQSFVCIGKALYDIHSHKYVQSFSVWPDAQSLNLSTKRITVRVTENWGNHWTCIYRLRMTGTRAFREPFGTGATN